jgi:hypothetical protein
MILIMSQAADLFVNSLKKASNAGFLHIYFSK